MLDETSSFGESTVAMFYDSFADALKNEICNLFNILDPNQRLLDIIASDINETCGLLQKTLDGGGNDNDDEPKNEDTVKRDNLKLDSNLELLFTKPEENSNKGKLRQVAVLLMETSGDWLEADGD